MELRISDFKYATSYTRTVVNLLHPPNTAGNWMNQKKVYLETMTS
jgi:hypothetical protein